ncbi:UNVERIFIED_CONTAM: hypothetical protein FKN15_054886 [Acipenser sinensis]
MQVKEAEEGHQDSFGKLLVLLHTLTVKVNLTKICENLPVPNNKTNLAVDFTI